MVDEMPLIRMQQQYPTDTGLQKDVQTNTMYFFSTLSRADMVTAINPAWETLLGALDGLMEQSVFGTTWTREYWDMSEDEPRIPFASDDYSATLASSTTSLPLEVSMVVSYSATPQSGVNMARRRGRLFLPTFNVGTIGSASGRVTWTSGTRTTVGNAFATFINAMRANSTPIFPVVFSPTIWNEQGMDFAYANITRLWIDDEPDTQRRRGTETTTKTTFTIT